MKTKVIHKRSGDPPKGALFLGVVEGQRLYLVPRDRSFALLMIGAMGTGKTVAMKGFIQQELWLRHLFCVIDPMGALFDWALEYIAYLKATGRVLPEVIIFNPSEDEWVLPFNPFQRREGELAVQVDRRVSATLRAWGQHTADETPRLEKWLRCLYTVLIECGLTILECAGLLDQHQRELRSTLISGLSNPFIRARLEQLSRLKPGEFADQTESVENRLMRFLSSGHLGRIFGVGTNALDFQKIMDDGKILLVNLKPSKFLSHEQARLIGTLLINEMYETALTRKSGSRPFYCYVDEAAQYVTVELAEALEQCRQKGLHFTLAFQHLAQFKEAGIRVYKAIKMCRNKLVFTIPDRQDALELADDLFAGLAEPQVKFMHRHLSHVLEDYRATSTTRTSGGSSSASKSISSSSSQTDGSGRSRGLSISLSRSIQRSSGTSLSLSSSQSHETSASESDTRGEQESHSWGYSQTKGHNTSETHSSATTTSRTSGSFASSGKSQVVPQSAFRMNSGVVSDSTPLTLSESSGTNESVTHSDTTAHAMTEGDSESETHSSQEAWSESRSHTDGRSTSDGQSRSLTLGGTRQRSSGRSRGQSRSGEQSQNESHSSGRNDGTAEQRGRNWSLSHSEQPGTHHIPFWEEDPEHWSLEEQRWRASELLMRQQIGHWFVVTSTRMGFGTTTMPQPFYILPKQLLRLTGDLYRQHNLQPEEADRQMSERLQRTLNTTPVITIEPAISSTAPDRDIWNRTGGATVNRGGRNGKRGPKTDVENHAKVEQIIAVFGADWRTDDNLEEICRQLDEADVPVPKTWRARADGKSHTWMRALENYRDLVVKAITDRLKAAKLRS